MCGRTCAPLISGLVAALLPRLLGPRGVLLDATSRAGQAPVPSPRLFYSGVILPPTNRPGLRCGNAARMPQLRRRRIFSSSYPPPNSPPNSPPADPTAFWAPP